MTNHPSLDCGGTWRSSGYLQWEWRVAPGCSVIKTCKNSLLNNGNNGRSSDAQVSEKDGMGYGSWSWEPREITECMVETSYHIITYLIEGFLLSIYRVKQSNRLSLGRWSPLICVIYSDRMLEYYILESFLFESFLLW